MPPEVRALLFDAQHAALGIQMFVAGKSLEDFKSDEMLRLAVERQFEIIGEALTRLRKFDASWLEKITESAKIIAFRNVLIHGYDKLDSDKTWQIIQEKLPILARELDALMKQE